MLKHAFLKTHDYRTLVETSDFSFVVGRRGAGKTALFLKVAEFFQSERAVFVETVTPAEYEILALRARLSTLAPSYNTARAIARLIWRTHLLELVRLQLLEHWKIEKSAAHDFLRHYGDRSDGSRLSLSALAQRLGQLSDDVNSPEELPAKLAQSLNVEKLQDGVEEALSDLNRTSVLLFDALDEGWIPESPATAVFSGLSASVSDLVDRKSRVRALLFFRDNLLRALAYFDPDYSRHIEPGTLRLRWDEESLLHLVANRLRASLKLDIESDVKVWNRFAHRELSERQGFNKCLNLTLYRPRDILVLLNRAYLQAARADRHEIVESDIETMAREISRDRLEDLLKEYEHVFPGLRIFVHLFEGATAFSNVETLARVLEEARRSSDFREVGASDFAVLGSGEQVLMALYSVGFIGIEGSEGSGNYRFCHDGAGSLDSPRPQQGTAIHPCYWRALNAVIEDPDQAFLTEIHDDYRVETSKEPQDLRVKQLGQLVTELPDVPTGKQGSKEFERWVFRSIKILFAGRLTNPELKPNPGAVQQRDIVATNMAKEGFWKRVLEDYGARQVLFEVKNYEQLKPEDYRQLLAYTGKDYGRFAVIVSRTRGEGLANQERAWLQEMYHQHERVLLTLPAELLVRFLRKIRNASRFDYPENALNKRLDTFCRSYLSISSGRAPRKRRRSRSRSRRQER